MRTSDFDYELPTELIAQVPVEPRDQSRLLVLHRESGRMEHRRFAHLPDYLRPGDVLVINDSLVLPARLFALKPSGGKVELLLLERLSASGGWRCLVKPWRRLKPGMRLQLVEARKLGRPDALRPVWAEIRRKEPSGLAIVEFSDEARLGALGLMPLPPYIRVPLADPQRYQTVYARSEGSAAAPTAGLHFTLELIERIRAMGVNFVEITLHIGLDTFRPIEAEDPAEHKIHSECLEVSPEAAALLTEAKARGRRLIAVGTTSVRALETIAQVERTAGRTTFRPWSGPTSLFILPGHSFKAVDALITNFHLPRSTLLLLVSAFAGRDLLLSAYREAIAQRYRFYSFGDSMLVL